MEFLMLLMVYMFPLLIGVIVFLIRRGFRLMSEIQSLQSEIDEIKLDTVDTLESMLSEMKNLDIRGAFETDDEVGAVFSELKNLIEKYKNGFN
jgi:hypothetical protein